MRMKRLNSLETLMKTRRVQGQNEHNSENHDVLEDILCEIYCLGLHKRLNNSRHRVHWLASKSDRLSLGKVQGRKLPILMQDIFDLYSFVKSAYCCISVVIKFHSCGGLLEMVGKFWVKPEFFLKFGLFFRWAPSVDLLGSKW